MGNRVTADVTEYADAWAVPMPDRVTVDALKSLLPDVRDRLMRAGVWNNIRSGFHNARIDPDDVLDADLAADPTAAAQVHHTHALASIPTAAAKAYAWSRFTGEVDVPNCELEAAGLGMCRWGQEELTAPYVERYFDGLPGTVAVRTGWLLAEAAEYFFPSTSLTQETLGRAQQLIVDDGLDPSIRRRLVDEADQLQRMLAVKLAYRG